MEGDTESNLRIERGDNLPVSGEVTLFWTFFGAIFWLSTGKNRWAPRAEVDEGGGVTQFLTWTTVGKGAWNLGWERGDAGADNGDLLLASCRYPLTGSNNGVRNILLEYSILINLTSSTLDIEASLSGRKFHFNLKRNLMSKFTNERVRKILLSFNQFISNSTRTFTTYTKITAMYPGTTKTRPAESNW